MAKTDKAQKGKPVEKKTTQTHKNQKPNNWKYNINPPWAASQRRVWKPTGRRKTAANTLWHFFPGQEYHLCELQNGQPAPSGPLVNFISEPSGQDVTISTCLPVLLSSFLFFTYYCVLYMWSAIWEAPTPAICLPTTARTSSAFVWSPATLPKQLSWNKP